jgi:hypothetical protein
MQDSLQLVVYPSPLEGSVLGRIVAGDSVLGQLLYWVAFCNANARLLASVQAELAALRKQQAQSKDNCLHGIRRQWCALCELHEYTPQAKEAFKSYFLTNKQKLLLPYIPGIEAKHHFKPITKVARPLMPSFDGEHRDYLSNEDAASAQKRFAGRDSVEIGYGQDAELKCDGVESFRSLNFTAMGVRERAWLKKESGKEPACLRRAEPVASPYNEAWNRLRQKALQERYKGHLNFCPRCWVARVRGVVIPKERACLDCIGLTKLDEAEATKATKRAKTLAEYCAEFTKKNNRKLAAKGWAGYSPEEYDRDILKSRGSVMDDVVHQFEKSHSRRLNKWHLR